MIYRPGIPLFHLFVMAVATAIAALCMTQSGCMTASAAEATWHYAAAFAGECCLYGAVRRLTESRALALTLAMIWIAGPATMGINAMTGPQGPMVSLSALCIYAVVRLHGIAARVVLTVTTACVLGVAIGFGASYLTGQPDILSYLQGDLKTTVIDLLYRQSAVRPGWCGDIAGAYLSFPWLLTAWVYIAYLWRIVTLRCRGAQSTATGAALWIMGLAGAPHTLVPVAFVLAALLLTQHTDSARRCFTTPAAFWVCMGIIVAWSLALVLTESPVWFGDTQSYYIAADRLACGQTDPYRPPLYPLLILASVRLFGTAGEWVIVAVQFLALWLSAAMLYRMLHLIWRQYSPGQAPFWVTLLYGIGAPTASMCLVIGTEPLATALLTAYAYAMTMLWKHGYALRRILLLGLSLLAAVALRPAMMYMIVGVGIFSAVALWKGRGQLAAVTACIAVGVTFTVLVYCGIMQRQTGLFTPSLVGTVNRYADMAYANPDLDSVTTSHPEVLADIKSTGLDTKGNLYIWTASMYMDRHGASRVSEFISDVETTRGSEIRIAKARRLASQYDMRPMMVQNSLLTYMNASVLTVPLSVVVAVMVLWPFFAMIRNRRMRIIPTLLYVLVAGNLLAVIIGAPDATPRLLTPSSPLLLFLGADLFLTLRQHLFKGKDRLVDSGKIRTFAE